MSEPPSSSSPSVAQAPSGEQKSAVPVVPATVPVEDLYDYNNCTVMLVVQLRPQKEPGQPRSVLVSAQNGANNKDDLPLYRLLPEDQLGGPLPPAITEVLDALRRDLPARKERHVQRTQAKKVPSQQASTTTQRAETRINTPRKIAPPPAVPAPTPAPKKNSVVIAGFDWFAE